MAIIWFSKWGDAMFWHVKRNPHESFIEFHRSVWGGHLCQHCSVSHRVRELSWNISRWKNTLKLLLKKEVSFWKLPFHLSGKDTWMLQAFCVQTIRLEAEPLPDCPALILLFRVSHGEFLLWTISRSSWVGEVLALLLLVDSFDCSRGFLVSGNVCMFTSVV